MWSTKITSFYYLSSTEAASCLVHNFEMTKYLRRLAFGSNSNFGSCNQCKSASVESKKKPKASRMEVERRNQRGFAQHSSPTHNYIRCFWSFWTRNIGETQNIESSSAVTSENLVKITPITRKKA